MKRCCAIVLLVWFLGSAHVFAQGYTLWDPSVPVPSTSAAPLLSGVEFHVIKAHEPLVDGYQWLHGGSIIRHEGTWYMTWGHNQGSENTVTEVTQGRRSGDDFQTLTPVEMIAPGTATEANSHGVTLSHNGELWGFFGRFTGSLQNVRTEAYRLNETTDQWESQGVVVGDGFWACDEPQLMDNGNYVTAGFRVGVSNGNPPAVAISNGDDLTDWDLVHVPKDSSLNIWGESSVIVRGNNLTNIVRANGSDTWAYVSTSADYGQTWSNLERSNLPMVASKPYAGTLSTGQDYLIGTTTADSGNSRRPLTIAVTDPGGGLFKEIYRIRNAVRPGETATTSADLAYPYAVEENGNLYVVYSVGRPGNTKNSLELAIVPLSSITAPSVPDHSNAHLIAIYEFEGTTQDSSGNNNHAASVKTEQYNDSVPAAISGRSAQSFDFNGSTHISLPFEDIDFEETAQTTGATLSVWIQTAGPQDQKYIFSAGSSSSDTPIYGLQGGPSPDTDKLRLVQRPDAGGTNFQLGSPQTFGNGWHHIALTDDGGTMQVWVDGVLDATLAYPEGDSTHNLNSLGALVRQSTGFWVTGQMDEAAFYNRVLSEQEIGKLAGGLDPRAVPEPTALTLLFSGLAGLIFATRRRANR